MAGEVTIQGLSELMKAMQELPKALEKKVMRQAVGAGAILIRKTAQDLVARRTGLIAKAIRVSFNKRESTPGRIVYHVFVSKKVKGMKRYRYRPGNWKNPVGYTGKVEDVMWDAFYWRFLEFGTVKMAAKPFMRPAFDSINREAAEVIKGKLADGIEKEAANLGKR
jgi:HK97 gp10 family phage protein